MILFAVGSTLARPIPAQDAAKPYGSLDELKASYARQLLDLDRRRIADMAALAVKQTGDECRDDLSRTVSDGRGS